MSSRGRSRLPSSRRCLQTRDFKSERAIPQECRLRLRTGKTQLVVSAAGSPIAYQYQFDPSRPENLVARESVNNALQQAAGRVDPVKSTEKEFSEPGGRYVDFLVPGLLGMSLMGGGLWGVGFVTVDMRIRKLLKRFLATPMKKGDFLAAIMFSRMLFMIPEVLVLLLFARLRFPCLLLRVVCDADPFDRPGCDDVFRNRPVRRQPGQDGRSRLGVDERRHAADVDALGHLLLIRPVSGGSPAADPDPALNPLDQRFAIGHAGGVIPRFTGEPNRDHGRVECRLVRRRTQDFPLAMRFFKTKRTPVSVKTFVDTHESSDFADRVRFCAERLAEQGVCALGGLYDVTASRLVRYASTLTRQRDDAEDAVQAALVRIALRPGLLAKARYPWAYLLKITRNEALNIVRRRRPMRSLDPA